MSKVLYIQANIKQPGESRTFQVADHFIEAYKQQNPEDEITTLDLYKENIDFLRPESLVGIFGPKDESTKNHPILKYTHQFAEADKYIIAAPMWNLSFPAILKAYFDYTTVAGITFKYTENGPVGMLEGKKALHVVARGGTYTDSPVEMGDRYIRTILGFYGVKDIETLAIEGLDVIGTNEEAKIAEAKAEAEKLAQKF